MKIIGTIITLAVMITVGLSANILLYSPDKNFESAHILSQSGNSVSTTSQKFGLEKASGYDAILVDAGINDIPPEMYVILKEYAKEGGIVVLALDPDSVIAYSVFEQVEKPDPTLCYSEPTPSKKLQHCFEIKLYQEELEGKLYSLISNKEPVTKTVVLEGVPIAYVNDKKAAVRTLTDNGQIIVAGFRPSAENTDFFLAAIEGKETKTPEPTSVQENLTSPEQNYEVKPSPVYKNESKITGRTIALLTKSEDNHSMLPWIAVFAVGAVILGYLIIKPGKNTEENQKTEPKEPKLGLPEQSPEDQAEEKDEFIY